MKVMSIHVGRSRPIEVEGRQMHTGIYKMAAKGPLYLDWLGFAGDEHVNKPFHGGEGRALYAISMDAYAFWRKHVDPAELKPGLFGENLLFDSLDESEFRVGDVFQLGETRVQATMPRIPCAIMAKRLGQPVAGKRLMYRSKRPGVLFRVIERGHVYVGDELVLVDRNNAALAFQEFWSMYDDNGKIHRGDFERLTKTPFLPDTFLAIAEKRIVEPTPD